jgi:hypothetical protein
VANNQRNQEKHKEKNTKWRSMKSQKKDKEDAKNLFVTEFLTVAVSVREFFYLLLFRGTIAHVGPWHLQQFASRYTCPVLVSPIHLYSAATRSPF